MILVDSTIWIDYFNGVSTPYTDYLDMILSQRFVLVGDIILAEVLQGFRSDRDFEQARDALTRFEVAALLSPSLALQSALNYRYLRKRGITVRKTVDCFIATYCIEQGHDLLHSDQDFDPFEEHLGLRVIHPLASSTLSLD